MQDRYAGDVGDFGKFSLLKFLFGTPHDGIGVIWYLFPDESHNEDGRYTGYLESPDFLNCDRDLCEKLSIVVHSKRSVEALEKARILPANTVYFSDRLNFHLQHPSQSQEDKKDRAAKRRQWLERATLAVSKCNVIFLDPDNGLQIPSCPKISQLKSGKFAYYSEVLKLTRDKDAIVIYQHLSFNGTHADQIRRRTGELRTLVNPTGRIFALRNRPYSPRVYLILTDKSVENRIRERLQSFSNSRYGRHWDPYHEEGIK